MQHQSLNGLNRLLAVPGVPVEFYHVWPRLLGIPVYGESAILPLIHGVKRDTRAIRSKLPLPVWGKVHLSTLVVRHNVFPNRLIARDITNLVQVTFHV